VQVIVRSLCIDSKKDLCLNLAPGRRIWQGAHRSHVLCGVGSYVSILVEDREKIIKKKRVGGCSPTLG
jgi:hypothetical protein